MNELFDELFGKLTDCDAMDLYCDSCRHEETAPFDVGDTCPYCHNGKLQLKSEREE